MAWGLDIGLLFSTWLTFAGAWWLAGFAILTGSPTFGAALLAAYWAGRAATIWLGPVYVPTATITPSLVLALRPLFRPFQIIHGLAVLAGVAVVASELVL